MSAGRVVSGESTQADGRSVSGPDVTVTDRRNGGRCTEPVDVLFTDVGSEPGRKPSPHAAPRGPETDYARPSRAGRRRRLADDAGWAAQPADPHGPRRGWPR